ncbi:hypothetical protein V8C44DRAFT_308476 [Trichoderma aethiopicum]
MILHTFPSTMFSGAAPASSQLSHGNCHAGISLASAPNHRYRGVAEGVTIGLSFRYLSIRLRRAVLITFCYYPCQSSEHRCLQELLVPFRNGRPIVDRLTDEQISLLARATKGSEGHSQSHPLSVITSSRSWCTVYHASCPPTLAHCCMSPVSDAGAFAHFPSTVLCNSPRFANVLFADTRRRTTRRSHPRRLIKALPKSICEMISYRFLLQTIAHHAE